MSALVSDADAVLPGLGHNNPPIEFEISDATWGVFFDNDGAPVFSPYKVLYGGRGGGKSWDIARLIISRMNAGCERVLCCRMYMNSIADSSYRLMVDQIYMLGLQRRFTITKNSIKCHATGAEAIFKGLQKSIGEIRSTEGITLCWVEEAEPVSKDIWDILIPTVFRRATSEIWISFNVDKEDGATYSRFVIKADPDTMIVKKIGWEDNPWFPDGLERERLSCLKTDPVAYEWIWGGMPRRITEAVIFRERVRFEGFDEPDGMIPYYGADWGFAADPTALIRSYVLPSTEPGAPSGAEDLFITHEAFGYGVEMDDLPALFDTVPGARRWPIKGDAARPETISYMRGKGFSISAAEKWPGSVEDGVAFLKAYRRIFVHPRCKRISQEFRLYSFKTDPKRVDENGQAAILPVIVDLHNHGIDAVRYSMDGLIQHSGGMGAWGKLGR